MKRSGLIVLFPVIIAALLLSVMLPSCSRVQYVPVQSTSYVRDSVRMTDSVVMRYKTQTVDSVRVRDSTVIVQDKDGNVIREEHYRETEKYRSLEKEYNELKRKFEALQKEKRDTVRVPYPVERRLDRWQQFKMNVGGAAIVAVVLILMAACLWIFLRIRKK